MNAAEAIRTSAVVSRASHVAAVRVDGPGAFETLDAIIPRELHLRDGQILHTLLLRDDARPRADLYVCCDDREYILLAEGMTARELADAIPGARPIEDRGIVSLDGPYAWEVFAEVAGPEVIGQPYMSFFHADDLTAFRVGKTGEYGYYLMVPDPAALEATLLDRGAPFDVVQADLDVLDQAALENWYFNIRREGSGELSPVELQLQWRVSARKQFAGAAALAERRARATHRIVQCACASQLAIGDRVTCGDREIGTIVNAGHSQTRGDCVAIALVERAYSHAGITAYAAAGHPLKTLAAPAINNRSLYVNPQQHSYQTRNEIQFPSLVLPEQRV